MNIQKIRLMLVVSAFIAGGLHAAAGSENAATKIDELANPSPQQDPAGNVPTTPIFFTSNRSVHRATGAASQTMFISSFAPRSIDRSIGVAPWVLQFLDSTNKFKKENPMSIALGAGAVGYAVYKTGMFNLAIQFARQHPKTVAGVTGTALAVGGLWYMYMQVLPNLQASIVDRAAWDKACAATLLNRQLSANGVFSFENTSVPAPCVSQANFCNALQSCITLHEEMMSKPEEWMNRGDQIFKSGQYVQKLQVPSTAKVMVYPDLHGDISSLLDSLKTLEERGYLKKDSFELKSDDHYMVFLGDYTDRGVYGVEVLYTIMRLKLANPNRVFLGRGNHETQDVYTRYGFSQEVGAKFKGNHVKLLSLVENFYKRLPAAIFIGCEGNFIQGCHGGLPCGINEQTVYNNNTLDLKHEDIMYHYNAKKILESSKIYDWSEALNDSTGFLWSDFQEESNGFDSEYGWQGRNSDQDAMVAGSRLTKDYLQTTGLKGILRAHQHCGDPNNWIMKGLKETKGAFPLYTSDEVYNELVEGATAGCNGCSCGSYMQQMPLSTVRTLGVAPDSGYGKGCDFDFYTCSIIHMAPKYEDWRLEPVWTQNTKLAALKASQGHK